MSNKSNSRSFIRRLLTSPFLLLISLLQILLDMIVYPLQSLRNFLKSLFYIALVLYVAA